MFEFLASVAIIIGVGFGIYLMGCILYALVYLLLTIIIVLIDVFGPGGKERMQHDLDFDEVQFGDRMNLL